MIYELYDLHDCMIDGELKPPETWAFMAQNLVASGAQLQMGGPICLRRSLHLGKIGKSREDLRCSISGIC